MPPTDVDRTSSPRRQLVLTVALFAVFAATFHAIGRLRESAAGPGLPGSVPFVPAVPAAREASRPITIGDKEFFAFKILNSNHYDMVIGGDSRSLHGVSPGEMRNHLPALRIFNFAFQGVSWSDDYLRGLHHLVDPTSRRKSVVLGISPRSLTFLAADIGFYEKIRDEEVPRIHRLGLVANLARQRFKSLINSERPGLANVRYKRHDDGWVASDSPRKDGLPVVERLLSHTSVDPLIVNEFLDRIKRWTAEGIAVYGFRPPIQPDVRKREDELVVFDQDNFIRRFQESGGIWLEVDDSGLEWWDGHHMNSSSAILFSSRLAKEIGRLSNQSPAERARPPKRS